LGAIHEIWDQYRDRVRFLVVYVREAHPEDGWVVTPNRTEDIRIVDPKNDEERLEAASQCALHTKIRMPVVVDPVDDKITSAYGALPTRLYLIGRGGRIAYQAERGPFGLKPPELEEAIKAELKRVG
jgi:NAD(P)H-hydrate repair Nnr-like enzyme with NAD(P)H-hydrate dehydratase domain